MTSAREPEHADLPTPLGVVTNQPDTDPASAAADSRSELVDVTPASYRIPSALLATLGVLVMLLLAYIIYKLLPVVALLFVSLLFATAIEPLVNRLRRGPFNRSAGILVVYTGLFVFIGIILFLTVPVFIAQIGELGSSLPRRLDEVKTWTNSVSSVFVRQQVRAFIEAAQSMIVQTQQPARPEEQVATVAQTTLGVAEAFFSVITFFVVAFYWLSERTIIKRAFMSWLPVKRANRVRRVWDDIEVKVGGWVRGQLLLMLLVGGTSAVGYFLIGVKYWPAMALFIALAEAIPLVGPYIGTAPAVIIALTQQGNDGLPSLLGLDDIGSLTRGMLVILFAVILQTIEGNVLVPRVMKNSVGITPLTVIVSLLVGASLAGLLGALIAVPIAGSLQVVIADIKAARESEGKFEAITEEAKQTREKEGELVVARPALPQTPRESEMPGA